MTQFPTLSAMLTREHREIDSAIELFADEPLRGTIRTELLTRTLEALRRHIYLEELMVFPPIREAGLSMPVFVMMREHGQLWRTMDAVAAQLADGTDALRDSCRHLLDQLNRHNSKEEPIIYAHADGDLPPHLSAELHRFIESGCRPEGWVCRHAREVPAESR